MGRLIRLSEVKPQGKETIDSVKRFREIGSNQNFNLLMQGQVYYDALRPLREDGERCLRYEMGDGWSDYIPVGNRMMKEEDYIKSQGKVPLQQNLIRRLVRNVVGLYRTDDKEPLCVARDKKEQAAGNTMSELLSYNWQRNKNKSKYSRGMEVFCIYGQIFNRHWIGWDKGQYDCWSTREDSNRMFWDISAEKDDLSDARMIGCIRDMSRSEMLKTFARSPKDYQRLVEVYKSCANKEMLQSQYERFGRKKLNNYDFFIPEDPSKCRVIEIWTLEQRPCYHCHDWLSGDYFVIFEDDFDAEVTQVNEARKATYANEGYNVDDAPLITYEWGIDEYWYYRYLTPSGIILQEGVTPYQHGGHPWVCKLYPMINGKVRSFVYDLIDIQRMVNRLITKHNWIIDASAKGALLMDERGMSDKQDEEQILDNWAKIGGVIFYNSANGGNPPRQLSANNTNVGIMELLNVQLKFIEDISSVNGALQGKPGYSSTSGVLYQQQQESGVRGLADLIESYNEFVCANAEVDVKNIQQSYDMAKVIEIVGEEGEDVTLKAEKAMNVDYDLSIVESTSSATYADRINEPLMNLLAQGFIDLRQMLKAGKFSFADRLLQALDEREEQLKNGQMPDALPQDVVQQAQQGADMGTVQRIYDAMRQPAA